MRPDQILDKAADVLVRNGWTQGGYWVPVRGVAPQDCAVDPCAAMNVAAGLHPGDEPESDVADAYVEFARHVDPTFAERLAAFEADTEILAYPDEIEAISEWNDHPDRTAEQVVAALRACAAGLRKQAAS